MEWVSAPAFSTWIVSIFLFLWKILLQVGSANFFKCMWTFSPLYALLWSTLSLIQCILIYIPRETGNNKYLWLCQFTVIVDCSSVFMAEHNKFISYEPMTIFQWLTKLSLGIGSLFHNMDLCTWNWYQCWWDFSHIRLLLLSKL